MENEDQRKCQASRSRVPPPPITDELNQVSSDFAMAMALQEQERLPTIESESSNEDDDDSEVASNDFNFGAYDYFESHDFDFDSSQSELQLLEGEGGDSGDFMEEDEIDVDELTYEELIALGEFIGQEKQGLSLNEISTCLHACKYCSAVENKSGIDRCVICQVEYEEGESMVLLRPCEHPYHSECISNWLQIKKICPICSNEVSPPKNMVITSKL